MGCCCTHNEYLNRKGYQINIDTLFSHHHYVNNITINSQSFPPKTCSQAQGTSSDIGNQLTQSQTNRPDSNSNKSCLRESVEEDFSFLNDFQNDYNEINVNQNQEPPPNNNYLGKNFMRFHGKLDTIRETNSDISVVKGTSFDERSAFSQSNNGCKIHKENSITHGNELIKRIRKIFSNDNKKNSGEVISVNTPIANEEEYGGQYINNNSQRKAETEMVCNFTRKMKTYQKRSIKCEIIESNEGNGNRNEMVTKKYTITYEDCVKQPSKYKNRSKFGCRSNSSKILFSDNYT